MSSCVSDQASDTEALFLQAALNAQRKQAVSLKFTGECLSCGETRKKGRFCDIDCRDDFERDENARLRNGE